MASSRRPGVDCPLSAATIERALERAGLAAIPPSAAEKLEAYLGLLLKWNARLNLTAVRKPEEIIQRHFVECIQCAQGLPNLPAGATLLDFGSGAGLPGIPIAICRPELRVTLAESQKKKVAFLRETVRSLGLATEIYDGRVEDMAANRAFSVVTLRAVDKMIEACRVAYKRVAAGGWIVPFATQSTVVEIKAALPDAEWLTEIPVMGSARGLLLFGKRGN